jgi:hypothetical protein
MSGGPGEDGEALRQRLLHPAGQAAGRRQVLGDHLLQKTLGLRAVGRIEDGPNISRHRLFQLVVRHVALRILLQMELAALPGHAPEDGAPRGGQSFMGIGGNLFDPTQATLDQLLQKARQWTSCSPSATDSPSTRRWPVASTPVAISTAASCTCPSWRTFS